MSATTVSTPKARQSIASKAKSGTKKSAKSPAKKVSSHPKYLAMAVAAISALKERNGSSRQAILKYIMNTYNIKLIDAKTVSTQLKAALRRGLDKKILKNVKGSGASGSFKLTETGKAKKPAAKKSAAVAKKSPAKAKKPKVEKVKKTKATKKPGKPKTAAKKVASPAKKSAKASASSPSKPTKPAPKPKVVAKIAAKKVASPKKTAVKKAKVSKPKAAAKAK